MCTDEGKFFGTLLDDSVNSELYELNVISEKIIGCAFKVGNTLGCGFLEKVYENALAFELKKIGVIIAQQSKISVMYEGVEMGNYEADLVVEGRVLVELKAVRDLNQNSPCTMLKLPQSHRFTSMPSHQFWESSC